MFFHKFREDFVLALKFLFQQRYLSLIYIRSTSGAGLECGSGVLEELLLPAVEHRRVNAVLVTQIRHWGALEEVETQNRDLLLSREALPDFLGHGKPPLEIVAYSSWHVVLFRLKQNNLRPQLVEEAFKVELITLVGQIGEAGGQADEFLEPAGLATFRDALLDQTTGFEHLEGDEAI
jgi:hypothetical protein